MLTKKLLRRRLRSVRLLLRRNLPILILFQLFRQKLKLTPALENVFKAI